MTDAIIQQAIDQGQPWIPLVASAATPIVGLASVFVLFKLTKRVLDEGCSPSYTDGEYADAGFDYAVTEALAEGNVLPDDLDDLDELVHHTGDGVNEEWDLAVHHSVYGDDFEEEEFGDGFGG